MLSSVASRSQATIKNIGEPSVQEEETEKEFKPSPISIKPACSSLYQNQTRNAIKRERLFLRKIAQMIQSEEWKAMDKFLSNPEEVTAYRTGYNTNKLAKSFRWTKTDDKMTTDEVIGLTSSFQCMSMGGSDLNSLQVVHYACRFNPPRTIVRHLASLYPQGVMLPDKMGRLPLHHAAKWGCSFRLIDYLLDKDKSAASVKDSLGKTPLHLLCENYSSTAEFGKGGEHISPEDNMIESTRVLIKAAPEIVNIEDNDDITAAEYCIKSGAPYDAVRSIQKASESDWKKRSITGVSHTEIQENLIEEQQQKQKEQELDRLSNTGHTVLPADVRRPKTRSKFAKTA